MTFVVNSFDRDATVEFPALSPWKAHARIEPAEALRSTERKVTLMKIQSLAALAAVAALSLTPCLGADNDASPSCSLESLQGMYVFAHYGIEVQDADGTRVLNPGDSIGVWNADGKGNITGMIGTKKSSNTKTITVWESDTGANQVTKWGEMTSTEVQYPSMKWTYTVEPNCRGTMTMTAPNGVVAYQSHFVLFNGGRQAYYMGIVAHDAVCMGTFRRADAFDPEREERLETIESDVKWVKEMIAEQMDIRLPDE